jgi:hypothetical protein
VLVLSGVLVADQHDRCLPGMVEAPAHPGEDPAVLAAEVIARILADRTERAKEEDARARRLASYTCPGASCAEPRCDQHSRPAQELTTYQPYRDAWPRYEVPVREDDAAEGHLYSYVRADELTDEEKADLSPEARAQVDADLAAMDAGAAVGADDERIDHEHGRDSARPLAAE